MGQNNSIAKSHPEYDPDLNFTSLDIPKRNILLDFDGTCAVGHSGGTYEDKYGNPIDPMDSTNKNLFKNNVDNWLANGHNVAIITRGIDRKVMSYFTNVLRMAPILNSFEKRRISIFAPDKTTFYSSGDDQFWANEKTEYVANFLDMADSWHLQSIFMDDTAVNVTKMNHTYPNMTCINVKKFGDYNFTFKSVNDFTSKQNGGRKRKRKHNTRQNKRTYKR